MKENHAKEEILRFLEKSGVRCRIFSHEIANDLDTKRKNDAANGVYGATHCKNLVLANRKKTRFFLLTMPFEKRFFTGPTSRQMGSGRLNFAEDEVLSRLLHTTPGKVSPLELIFDEGKILSFFMDEDLKSAESLCFHPADDTCTVVIPREEFFEKLLPTMEVTPNFVSIPESDGQ